MLGLALRVLHVWQGAACAANSRPLCAYVVVATAGGRCHSSSSNSMLLFGYTDLQCVFCVFVRQDVSWTIWMHQQWPWCAFVCCFCQQVIMSAGERAAKACSKCLLPQHMTRQNQCQSSQPNLSSRLHTGCWCAAQSDGFRGMSGFTGSLIAAWCQGFGRCGVCGYASSQAEA